MLRACLGLLLLVPALLGCQTTADAQREVGSRWIGRHIDEFFIENGQPESSFALQNGGTVFRWSGGNETRDVPINRGPTPAGGWSRTTGTSQSTFANNAVTTTSTSTTVGFNPAGLIAALQPTHRTVSYGCDADIATDAAGRILNVRLSRDTTGVGFSMSRCAEVFGTGQR
jgi:hypothetical protein